MNSISGGGCRDKPKKQKTHLRGKAGFHKLNSLTQQFEWEIFLLVKTDFCNREILRRKKHEEEED